MRREQGILPVDGDNETKTRNDRQFIGRSPENYQDPEVVNEAAEAAFSHRVHGTAAAKVEVCTEGRVELAKYDLSRDWHGMWSPAGSVISAPAESSKSCAGRPAVNTVADVRAVARSRTRDEEPAFATGRASPVHGERRPSIIREPILVRLKVGSYGAQVRRWRVGVMHQGGVVAACSGYAEERRRRRIVVQVSRKRRRRAAAGGERSR